MELPTWAHMVCVSLSSLRCSICNICHPMWVCLKMLGFHPSIGPLVKIQSLPFWKRRYTMCLCAAHFQTHPSFKVSLASDHPEEHFTACRLMLSQWLGNNLPYCWIFSKASPILQRPGYYGVITTVNQRSLSYMHYVYTYIIYIYIFSHTHRVYIYT